MEAQSDDQIIYTCGKILKNFLPREWKISRIVEVRTSNWKSSEHFGGTYSFREVEGALGEKLAEPLFDNESRLKVQFAGEATHDEYFSTVHGAIESGWREADRLIAAYPA